MNEKIQELVITEKWDDLYNYLGQEEVPTDVLNKPYKFRPNNLSASLMSIALRREEADLFNFLLEKGCELNPKNELHPLELCFTGLFFVTSCYWELDYNYADLSKTNIYFIKKILTHAINNSIALDLGRIPLKVDPKGQVAGNDEGMSYLQLICAGKALEGEKEEHILKIVELFIKAGVDIHHINVEKCSVLDHVTDPKILNKLLEICNFNYEFIDNHLTKLYEEFEEAKKVYACNSLDLSVFSLVEDLFSGSNPEQRFTGKTPFFQSIIKASVNYILYNHSAYELKIYREGVENSLLPNVRMIFDYRFNKFEKKAVVQAFMHYLPKMLSGSYNDKDLPEITLSSDVEEAFIKYLDKKDILNLKLICKAINDRANDANPKIYLERLKRERETEPASCIMM